MAKRKLEVDYTTIVEELKREMVLVKQNTESVKELYQAELRKNTFLGQANQNLKEEIATLEAKNTQSKIAADKAIAEADEAKGMQRYLEGVIKGKDDMIQGLQDILKGFTMRINQ